MLFEDKAGLPVYRYTTVNISHPGDSLDFQDIIKAAQQPQLKMSYSV